MKISEVPNSMYLYQNFNEDIKDPQNNNINNINNINDLNDYDFDSYQNNQKISLNNQMEEAYQEGGEDINDQIQSYKEQLIDAKLKNIKLTNEVQKLKELSRTQSQFYGDEMDPQNQTDSMFYKGNNPENYAKQIEKYEKKIAKYHEKIKALKDHNSKLEDLVLKLKDTLDRANEVFPNFLMQLSNSANNNNTDQNNNNNKKENPLMVSVGEDPINSHLSGDNNNNNQNYKIMEENRQLGIENLELKNALTQLEEELENMKSDRNMLGSDFDNKLKLIQQEMENTNKKNEELLNDKIQEFNEDLAQKRQIIEAYKNENDKLKKENQKYLVQIKSLNNEAQQHIEEINMLEEQIKNNEYLLQDKNGKDNIIQQLKNEIEQYKIENEDIINETNNKIEEYENKIKIISEESNEKIDKLNQLNEEIQKLNDEIDNKNNENNSELNELKKNLDNKNNEIIKLNEELKNKKSEIEKIGNEN